MARIRPKILLTDGRINEPVQVPLVDLIVNSPKTSLGANTASGETTLSVKNTAGLDSVYTGTLYALVGNSGDATAELIEVTMITAPETITLSTATAFPHSFGTSIQILPYDQVEISIAPTVNGIKDVLITLPITPSQENTEYNDDESDAGYYYGRFYNSVDEVFSAFSDPAPYEGYTLLSARAVIDAALGEINKKTSEVLSDDYAFTQLDACQTECLREQKRWMFMQMFNAVLGRTETGTWRVAIPTDLDDKFTNKSLWNARIGKQPDMTFVDKTKWDQLTSFVAWTTLAEDLNANDVVVVLENSDNFDNGGAIQIGGRSLSYTENDRDTGILTLSVPATAEDVFVAGQDVFTGASLGEPTYFTIFGGYLWHYPVTGPEFDSRSIFQDYYKQQTRIRHDSDELVIPDPTVAMYYLEWKFLKKLNNGKETNESAAAKANYIERREKMKQKDSIGRTFRLKPLKNSLNERQFPGNDPKWVRDGAFPNI